MNTIMANIKTRIITKNDELTAWENSSLTLLEGEIVLAKVTTTDAQGNEIPHFLAKVGKGDATFAGSPWLYAKAQDVYGWAKKSSLDVADIPALDISKITGLQAALNAKVATSDFNSYKDSTATTLTNLQSAIDEINNTTLGGYATTAQLEAVEDKADANAANIATIMSADATTVGSIAKALADAKTYADGLVNAEKSRAEGIESGLADRLTTAEGKLETIQGTGNGSIAKALTDAKAYTDTEVAKANNAAEAAQNAADDAQSYAEGVAGDLQTEITNRQNADTTTLNSAKDYADDQDEALHTTISKEIDDDVDAAKTALQADIAKKVDTTTYNAKMTELESADTTMSGKITAIETKLANVSNVMDFVGAGAALPETAQKGDVYVITSGDDSGKEFVFDGSEWVEFGSTTAELAAIEELDGRVEAVEGKLDGITGTVESAISSAVAAETANRESADTATLNSAKAYTDEREDAIEAAYKAADKTISDTVSGIGTRLGTAESDINTLQTEMDAVESVAAGAASQAATNKTDIANEVTARTNADTALGERIDDLDEAYKAADVTLQANINKKVDQEAYSTKITEIESDIGELVAKDTALDGRIKTLEAIDHSAYAKASDVTALTGRVSTNESNITTLRTDVDAVKANYLKVTDGAVTDQSGAEIIFDCGGAD